MTAPHDAYAAANILQDLGYNVLYPSFSDIVDVRLRSTRAEVTIFIEGPNDFTYSCAEGGQTFVTTDWDDVLSALAADKAYLDALPRPPFPPPWFTPAPVPREDVGEVAPYVSEVIYALALALALGCAWTAGLALLWAVGVLLGAWS